MTKAELDKFLEEHEHIEWAVDGNVVLFRDTSLDWYNADPGRCTSVTKEKMDCLTADQLLKAIRQGLEVEQMTRVTGYFAKVGSWNPGKKGELKDRHRENDNTI
jgi:hypothetical protein